MATRKLASSKRALTKTERLVQEAVEAAEKTQGNVQRMVAHLNRRVDGLAEVQKGDQAALRGLTEAQAVYKEAMVERVQGVEKALQALAERTGFHIGFAQVVGAFAWLMAAFLLLERLLGPWWGAGGAA